MRNLKVEIVNKLFVVCLFSLLIYKQVTTPKRGVAALCRVREALVTREVALVVEVADVLDLQLVSGRRGLRRRGGGSDEHDAPQAGRRDEPRRHQ